MKKIIFIGCLFVFGSTAWAEFDDKYIVEKPDGSVAIVYYNSTGGKSLGQVLQDQGLLGLPIDVLRDSDLPADRSDRKYWRMNKVPVGKKIKIDTVAKEQDALKEQQSEEDRQAVLTKLKITKEEFERLKPYVEKSAKLTA